MSITERKSPFRSRIRSSRPPRSTAGKPRIEASKGVGIAVALLNSPERIKRLWGTTILGGVLAMAATAPQPADAILIDTVNKIKNPTILNSYDPISLNTQFNGPLTFNGGKSVNITYSAHHPANSSVSLMNYDGAINFGARGTWNPTGASGTLKAAYLNSYNGYIDFRFGGGTLVSAVGGFFNYSDSFPDMMQSFNITVNRGITLTAFDALNNILETYSDYTFNASGSNSGQFIGIKRNVADIAGFRVANNYAAISNFTYSTSPTQAPAPVPILGALAAFGYSRKLRRRLNSCQPTSAHS